MRYVMMYTRPGQWFVRVLYMCGYSVMTPSMSKPNVGCVPDSLVMLRRVVWYWVVFPVVSWYWAVLSCSIR